MRFSSIRVRGFGPFKDEVAIDFEAIDATLIAVTGENGAGKSTLLELLAASLYRETPTRGRLAALATDRNALLETTVVNGARHTLRHLVDCGNDKGESIVLDADGRAVTASAKLTEFKAWAAEHLPPPELLYSSVFAAQGSGGFLDLKAGDRKAVLLRSLGVERLEAMAEKARENARNAKAQLLAAATRVEDERERIGAASDVESALAAHESRLEQARKRLADAEAAAKNAREAADAVRAELAAAAAVAAQRDELAARIAKTTAAVADRDERIRNNMKLLDRGKEIRAAAARLVEVEGALGSAEVSADRSRSDADTAREALRVAESNEQKALSMVREARADVARAETVLRDADAVAEAGRSLAAIEYELAAAKSALDSAEQEYQAAQDARAVGDGQRIAVLRGALDAVGNTETLAGAHALAKGTLSADARVVAESEALPARLAAARAALKSAQQAHSNAETAAQRARQFAKRAGEMELARGALSAAQRETSRHAEQAEAYAADVRKSRAALENAESVAGAARDALAALRAERDSLQQDAMRVARLDEAQKRIEELNAERTQIAGEAREMEERLAAMPSPADRAVPDTSAAEREVEAVREEVTTLDVALRLARERLAARKEAQARLAPLEKARAEAEEELSEWQRLADDLGRDGLQALEIDAAGPELTALVNDLLHTCVGPRWTVTVETQRSSADGKKTIEGCEVRVLDTVAGREAPVETFSGGERVMIGEAVSLALSMLSCRRSGLQGVSLIRDETGAALDEARSSAYVAMLRRAAQLVGASRIFFVSHNPATWELADARLHVAGGKVTVQ